MDTRSRTTSPAPDVELFLEHPHPAQDKISAYYSLVFPHITFYIQTLAISIGRRCSPNSTAPTSSTSEQLQVDVDLGALKSVSRLHAKIEYDQDEDRFVLVVVGRNGAWVDGVWCGAGTRAALSERSHIQIASRTFTFVLPPPPPPSDTPSPSSQSSANRARSPSVDITSISPPSSQPSHSPPPKRAKLPPPSPEPQIEILPDPEPVEQSQLPNSNSIGKGKGANPKKRKKGDVTPILKRPEVMPPKPPFTYAQLIYRAIKAIDGKATLQEICNWIMTTHDYYKYADNAWMSSVRHNLSSGRAFLKMERCGGDRGKGFFWSIDEQYAQNFEEQEAKALQNAAAGGGKDGMNKPGRRKDKNTPLEPPLKRSVKGDLKGPLPPPLTSVPLIAKVVTANPAIGSTRYHNTKATTGVFAYNTQSTSSSQTHPSTSYPVSVPPTNPYAALAQQPWGHHLSTKAKNSTSTSLLEPHGPTGVSSSSTTPASALSSTANSTNAGIGPSVRPALPPINTSISPSSSNAPTGQNGVPDVVIPIILGPIPATHPDYALGQPNNSAKAGYMILHERKLILDPDVFSTLTQEMLRELEKMGAMAAVKVLTGHMVRALKERRAKSKNKDKSAKKAAKAAKKAATTGSTDGTLASTSILADGEVDVGGPDLMKMPSTELKPPHPIAPAVPVPVPVDVIDSGDGDGDGVTVDPGTPIVIIDDSEDEGPVAKRRRLDDGMDSMDMMAAP